MQRLYKVEIFDNQFRLIGHSAILEPELSYDYLSVNASAIVCLHELEGIKQYQLAHITDNTGAVLFQGIVYGFVQEKDALMQITVKPLLSLMDRTFSTEGYVTQYNTVEGWMAAFCKAAYMGDAQIPESYQNTSVAVTSHTLIEEERDPAMASTMNMYSYTVDALQTYGILVSVSFDPSHKRFDFYIGKEEKEPVTIEADRENIIQKTFNIDGDGERYNMVSLFFRDNDGAVNTRGYVLNADGNITEASPPDCHFEGIDPPRMTTFVDIGTGYDANEHYPPDSVWLEKAREVLKPEADSREITLAVSTEDKLVRVGMEDMGRTVRVLHAGVVYQARLTGVTFTNGVKTLVCGFARTDLTSILTFQRRGKIW